MDERRFLESIADTRCRNTYVFSRVSIDLSEISVEARCTKKLGHDGYHVDHTRWDAIWNEDGSFGD